MAAIDMALWDALARAHGLPLVRLLGGVPRPISAYGATGFDGAGGSARVAAEWAERGFQGVKAKIGYPDAREDVEVVRAMRHAVGDGIALMVDYNQSLMPTEAIDRGRRLDDEGLTWMRNPLSPTITLGTRELRGRCVRRFNAAKTGGEHTICARRSTHAPATI